MGSQIHPTAAETRAKLVNQIESIVLIALEQICHSQAPKISAPLANLDDYSYRKEIVEFTTTRGRVKMTRLITVLAQAYQLLVTRKIQTKRSFFYELKGSPAAWLFKHQNQVDQQLMQIAYLLKCPTWQLGFIAAAKGLVYGNLNLTFNDGETLDCTLPGGILIPQVQDSTAGQITHFHVTAKSILVVEKESIFQMLLEQNCPQLLNTILITGKGYPDVATRFFVKLMAEKLKLPVYIMVDANPHGFEIMCTYKYGSANLWWENKYLTCSNMQWIGVYPSELIGLCLPQLVLSLNDKKKLESLMKRSYISCEERQELEKMYLGKAEIEALVSITPSSFLTTCYLATKIFI